MDEQYSSIFTDEATKSAIGNITSDLYILTKNKIGETLSKWNTTQRKSRLRDHYKSLRNVKTIWQVDKPLDLVNFYYDTKIKDGTDRPIIRSLSDFGKAPHRIIIRGTAGHGKSIFLRFLASRELLFQRNLPLFIELRNAPRLPSRASSRPKALSSTIEWVQTELSTLHPDVSREVTKLLAEEGRLTLFFDGFDEIPKDRRESVQYSLSVLSRAFPKLSIIISSRYDSNVEYLTDFHVYSLSELTPEEAKDCMIRLAYNMGVVENAETTLSKCNASITELMRTPLMVALVLISFRAANTLPENVIDFYRSLFPLLADRHDKTKAGYVRPRQSELSDRQLLRTFDLVSFLLRTQSVTEPSIDTLMNAAEDAIHRLKYIAKSDLFVNDIRDITNLWIQDGHAYQYIHRTIQEFHASRYICSDTDLADAFYMKAHANWDTWNEELYFLQELDDQRFRSLFLGKQINDVFLYAKCTPIDPAVQVGHSLATMLYGHHLLYFEPECQLVIEPPKSSPNVSPKGNWYLSRVFWSNLSFYIKDIDLSDEDQESAVLWLKNNAPGKRRERGRAISGGSLSYDSYEMTFIEALKCPSISKCISDIFENCIVDMQDDLALCESAKTYNERNRDLIDMI